MDKQTRQETIAVFHEMTSGMLRHDVTLLKQVIAPDAIFVHLNGKVQSREVWLDQMRIGRMRYLDSNELTLTVTEDGTDVVIVSRSDLTARIYGFENCWHIETTTRLAQRNNAWQITRSQAQFF
ncbi:nuclear transport factor 2 family protein [Lapidilactobacillus achengensis]|uniref:Nuclear transport factor 2 family protein n=1 Tax=Lapidilactobacillus achengensis TaxID=2486000 RepID=A0ABW1UL24_9LACO|nr:nuclear transport factor 2 family protein [Lapidilactobacillus achengensis]